MTAWAFAMMTPTHVQVLADSPEECLEAACVVQAGEEYSEEIAWSGWGPEQWMELATSLGADIHVVPR